MKTTMKLTIRNATKSKLLDYIADVDSDYPAHLTLSEIRRKVKQCENKSRGWFGRTYTFEEWAN